MIKLNYSKLIIVTLVLFSIFSFGVVYGRHITEPVTQYVEVPIVEYVEVPSLRVETQYIEKLVPIHNEPGLWEFESKVELEDYVIWYRNERMVQYGTDQCEDYAYDFMQQAIADGYVVSTELYEKKIFDNGVLHMANTVPIGNEVYLVEISAGSVKLLALKD